MRKSVTRHNPASLTQTALGKRRQQTTENAQQRSKTPISFLRQNSLKSPGGNWTSAWRTVSAGVRIAPTSGVFEVVLIT